MMDPPRHACRGRPMVCPGPCNPLKTHHHHHRRRHHHHRRQNPDVTGVVTPDVSLLDEFSQITLLKSLKIDDCVTSVDVVSTSRTSSSTRIATRIRTPKTPQYTPIEIDMSAITWPTLPPKRLAMLEEPSRPRTKKTYESAPSRKVESPILTIIQPMETAASTAAYQAPVNLSDATRAIMTRLNELTPNRVSPVFLCLTILVIYAGIHVIACRTPAYEFFVSSQICGVFAFLMWRLTGTILI